MFRCSTQPWITVFPLSWSTPVLKPRCRESYSRYCMRWLLGKGLMNHEHEIRQIMVPQSIASVSARTRNKDSEVPSTCLNFGGINDVVKPRLGVASGTSLSFSLSSASARQAFQSSMRNGIAYGAKNVRN